MADKQLYVYLSCSSEGMTKVYPHDPSSTEINHEIRQVPISNPKYILAHTQRGVCLCEV